jgi:hypothetical protein
MNPPKLFKTLAIAGVLGAIGAVGVQSQAQALRPEFNVDPGSFTPAFFSVFGDVGPKGVGPACPLCDSTVSTIAYRTLGDGNWTDDVALTTRGLINPTFLKVDDNGDLIVDVEAEWVFFYQVVNTNPLTDDEAPLAEFSITTTDKNGHPVAHKPYASGGFYDGLVFENASTAIDPLDRPNDWEAQPLDLGLAIAGDSVNPAALNHVTISNNTIAVFDPNDPNSGAKSFAGVEFIFPEIPSQGFENILPDETSSILFLTASRKDANGQPLHIDLIPAETESPGGEGAAGDVFGVKKDVTVPEPGTVLGLLAMSGLGLVSKRKKQK